MIRWSRWFRDILGKNYVILLVETTIRRHDLMNHWRSHSMSIVSSWDPLRCLEKNHGIKIVRVFRNPPHFIFSVHAEVWTKNRSDEIISRMTPFWWRSDRSRLKKISIRIIRRQNIGDYVDNIVFWTIWSLTHRNQRFNLCVHVSPVNYLLH